MTGLKVTPEIKEKILKRFENYLDSQEELSEDNLNMLEFLPYLLQLQNEKALVYGRSYCKYGDSSIFMNVQRKWDRIENIMIRALDEGLNTLYSSKSSTPTETFVDTVVDLASYGCLWSSYIMKTKPEEFKKFVDSNKLNSCK